jgi:hypothetical protein
LPSTFTLFKELNFAELFYDTSLAYNDYDKRRKPDRTEAEVNDSNEVDIAKKRNGFMTASSYVLYAK